MLETLLITFREGLEAFLIVAIMLAFVTKTGRTHLIKPIYGGLIVALIISATTGWHIAELAQEPVWEGTLAIIAGILVASFTIHIMKNAKNIGKNITGSIEKQDLKSNLMAAIGVFLVTTLMVAREGMETALMLGAISAQKGGESMLAGGLGGLLLIGIIAYLWKTQSTRINLRLFMQVTGVFLVLFSLHLFAYGLHELSEMAAIPLIGDEGNMAFHTWSEPIESAFFSNLVTFGLLGVPCFWLGIAFLTDKLRARQSFSAAE